MDFCKLLKSKTFDVHSVYDKIKIDKSGLNIEKNYASKKLIYKITYAKELDWGKAVKGSVASPSHLPLPNTPYERDAQ